MSTRAQQILETFRQLETQRAQFDRLYEQVAQYCLPRDAGLLPHARREAGHEYEQPVESVGIRSAQHLASGLFSNTVALGQEWFRLRAADEQLNKVPEVQDWLAEAGTRVLRAIQNSNFSLETHEMLITYAVFGTGIVGVEMNEQGRLVFRHYSAPSVYLTEAADGTVDGLYRRWPMTARQIVDHFQAAGDSIPQKIRDDAVDAARAQTVHEIIHAVTKRRVTRRGTADVPGPEKAWASEYVCIDEQAMVRESGYDSFPFACPRFYKAAGETYGRSPAMNALADLRQLDRASEDYCDVVEMHTVPPVFLPDAEAYERCDLRPGARNLYDPTTGGQPVVYAAGGNAQVGLDFLMRKEEAIREAFFVDLFLALEDQKNMSATEVVERVSERIQAISPVVSRLQSEYFEHIIVRSLELLLAAGRLPELPMPLQGADYEVVYTSRLDAKLAQVENDNVLRALQQAGNALAIIGQSPMLGAYLDVHHLLDNLMRNNNVDPAILRSKREAEATLQEQAQAQAAQAGQAALMEKVAPVDLAQPVQPGTPLEAVLAAAGQQGAVA